MAHATPYCKESENFFRVAALLIEEGTKALRIIFDQHIKHSHGTLENALKLPPVEKLMKNFLHGRNGSKKLLYQNQYNLLYPGHGKCAVSTSFDITLLNFLYRNLLKITNNWPSSPSDSDQSLPADVARITIIRNEVFGHITNSKLNQDEFDTVWAKLETILKRLNVSENDISSWKNKTLLPEEKAEYESELYRLIQQDFLLMQDTLRMFQDCNNLLCSKLNEVQLSETTVSNICHHIEGFTENNVNNVTLSICSLANSLKNVNAELKNNCCKDDVKRLYMNLKYDLERLFQVHVSEEGSVKLMNQINQNAWHNKKQTTKILEEVNKIKEQMQNQVKCEKATTNMQPPKQWPDSPQKFLHRRNDCESTSQLCSWSLPLLASDKTAILTVGQSQLQFIDVKLSGAPKSDGNRYSSINKDQEKNIIWKTPSSVLFVSEESSEFFINKHGCVVDNIETCGSSNDPENEGQKLHTKIDVLFASKTCYSNQILMDGNRVCSGIIAFSGETLNQWCAIFADDRIIGPDLYEYRLNTLLDVDDFSPVKFCLSVESVNIKRVVHSFSIAGLVVQLHSWNVISGRHKTRILENRQLPAEMLEKLLDELEECSVQKFKIFISVLKFEAETFGLGCHIGHTFENLRNRTPLHTTGLAEEIGVINKKHILTLNQSTQTEELCRNLVSKKKDTFYTEVTGLTSENATEKIQVTSGSIIISLQIEDTWQLENLKKNIDCGLFLQQYCEWIHKNGGEMDDEFVKIKLMSGDKIVAEYSGQAPKYIAFNKSESEELFSNAAVDSRTKLDDILNETGCQKINMILQNEDAPSPQRLAVCLETENIAQYLQHEDKATIKKIIEDLCERLFILNDQEYVELQGILENCGKEECLFNIAAFIEDKTPLEIESFVNLLVEQDDLKELGMHIGKVLDYCKDTAFNKSESEELFSNAAVDSWTKLDDVLNEIGCQEINKILQSWDAPSPQSLAIRLETENIAQYLQHEDEVTIKKIIEDLCERFFILNKQEYVKLQDVLKNCGKEKCLSNITVSIEDKAPLEIERFINFLIERDFLKELGMHISKVLDYCKNTKATTEAATRKQLETAGGNTTAADKKIESAGGNICTNMGKAVPILVEKMHIKKNSDQFSSIKSKRQYQVQDFTSKTDKGKDGAIPKVKAVDKSVMHSGVLGKQGASNLIKSFRHTKENLSNFKKNAPKELKSFEAKHQFLKFCYFNGHIWTACWNDNCIDVYTVEGKCIRTISCPSIQTPWALHPLTSQHMLVAAESGLYTVDVNTGNTESQLIPGGCQDVHVTKSLIAVLADGQDGDNDSVHILSTTPPYTESAHFSLMHNRALTLLVHGDYIYISAGFQHHHITKYNMSGQQLEQFGEPGLTQPGGFRYPRLCLTDNSGSILVADWDYNSIQLLNDGYWSVIKEVNVKRPTDVIVVQGQMFINSPSWKNAKIFVYQL